MRLVFAGTPEFAAVALRRLHAEGFDIPLVLTQPDRPAGRGMKLHASPVKAFALDQHLPLAQPRSLRLDGRFPADAQAAQAMLAQASADAMVVAAYGLILPQWVLDALSAADDSGPGLGCLNIHASLLPRWRGAAPIHRAIEAGDASTGVTIMRMDSGLDTGDMLLAQAIPIRHDAPAADTSASLHDKLAALGAGLIVDALRHIRTLSLQARPQPADGVTYARKVEKSDARIDWEDDAALVERRIRAFNPAPGAWSPLAGEAVKLWRAELVAAHASTLASAGTILQAGPGGIDVACGQGVVRLYELQRAGARRMDAAALLRGWDLHAGMRFDAARAGG